MWLLVLVVIFIIFSFLGYVLEYFNECLNGEEGCRVHHSFLAPKLPFLPIYGFGGVLLWLLTPTLSTVPVIGQYLFLVVLFTIFEYICGVLGKRFTGVASWEYSNGMPIDLTHSLVWGAFGLIVLQIFQFYLFPWYVKRWPSLTNFGFGCS